MRGLSGVGRGQAELSATDVHEWLAGTLAFDGEAVSSKSVTEHPSACRSALESWS
jgi:hypothetical protein